MDNFKWNVEMESGPKQRIYDYEEDERKDEEKKKTVDEIVTYNNRG